MKRSRDFFRNYTTALVFIAVLFALATGGSVESADAQVSSQTGSVTTEHFNHAQFRAKAGSLTVITFDDLKPGNGVLKGNEYAARGLTIVQRDGHPINVLASKDNKYYHPTNFNSQPNGISSASGVNNSDWPDRSDNFDLILSKPANAAGLWIGNLNSTTEIQFLSAGQCVVARQKVDGNHKSLIKGASTDPWDNRIFYGITTYQTIERIRIINPANDSDAIVLDDIQFGSAAGQQPVKPRDQSIRIFSAVPFQDSHAFKSATHKSLRVPPPHPWDQIPYYITKPFSKTITARPGQRALLAGDPLGKSGWRLDNFLLVEIENQGRTERLIIGHTHPVEYQGQRLRQIGPQSMSFTPESIDLSPYFPKNVPFRLTISALDYGGIGGVSDLFLVVRDAGECPEAVRRDDDTSRESTQILRASLAFEERVAAWKAEVRKANSDYGRLLRRKVALEKTILDAAARAERAVSAEAELKPLIERAESREREMLNFLQRLRAGERRPPTPKVRAAVQGLAFVEKDIKRLEGEIARARTSGKDISALQTQLSRRRQQQREFERDLNEQFQAQGDETGNRFFREVRKLQEIVLERRRKEAALIAEQARAETKLSAAVSERAMVDTRLLELAEILATFDPAIRAVTADAGGKTVFRAVSSASFAALVDINTRIAESEQVLAQLDRQRRIARDQFFTAANEASASEARLADELYNLAWRRFVVDLGFDTVDVMQAMTKGGIIGALTELGKKAVERRAFPLVDTLGVDPGSIEADINAMYSAQLKDAWSGASIARVAAERGIKDLVTKRAKDTLNKRLGVLVFNKIEGPWRLDQAVKTIEAIGTSRGPGAYNRASKMLDRLRAQHDDITKGFKYELKDAGKSILKDGLKTVAKGYLDLIEREAWTDFIEKDALARLAFPYHQIASHYYWEAFDNHEALLQEKATLLEGLDPETGLKTVVSRKFARKAVLRITLDLVMRRGGRDDIEVLVGGLRAKRAGNSRVYEVSVERTAIAKDGTLSLVLR